MVARLRLKAAPGRVKPLRSVHGGFGSKAAAAPVGVDMDRVASTLRMVEEVCAGRLTAANAMEAIARIAEAPPAPVWLFTLAAAVGAVALAVLFGVSLVLCGVRLWTHSLAASTLIHATYNGTIFTILFFGTGGFRHLDKIS